MSSFVISILLNAYKYLSIINFVVKCIQVVMLSVLYAILDDKAVIVLLLILLCL